jgi:GNAT superfamily N-acetyltransferase
MTPVPLRISTEVNELDIPTLHEFLSRSPGWAKGISLKTFARSIRHSLCFGGYIDSEQVAFARVISDRSTFASVVDVFVLPEHHGRGYGRALMNAVLTHPDLQQLNVGFGFLPPTLPLEVMARYCPESDSVLASTSGTALPPSIGG